MREQRPARSLGNSGVIDIYDDLDRARWAASFDVSEAILLQAIRLVGPTVPELAKVFGPSWVRPGR